MERAYDHPADLNTSKSLIKKKKKMLWCWRSRQKLMLKRKGTAATGRTFTWRSRDSKGQPGRGQFVVIKVIKGMSSVRKSVRLTTFLIYDNNYNNNVFFFGHFSFGAQGPLHETK